MSFIIGHRGLERLPHLMHVLGSIAGQRRGDIECIVIEQSSSPQVLDQLPTWVRSLHLPVTADFPFSRSWAFNVGARAASGDLLVFHDNDMLIPTAYTEELVRHHEAGYDVINLKRFVFYLDERQTERVFQGLDLQDVKTRVVVQNLEGGGSLAVDREAFFELGGFDEEFVGWGGEDNEFWERSHLRAVWSYGYLPIVHLWHAPQPEKGDPGRSTMALLDRRTGIPAPERVRELTGRDFGRMDGHASTRECESSIRGSSEDGNVRD